MTPITFWSFSVVAAPIDQAAPDAITATEGEKIDARGILRKSLIPTKSSIHRSCGSPGSGPGTFAAAELWKLWTTRNFTAV